MTHIEKCEKRELDAAKKNAARMRKKVSTTLRWMDIKQVTEDSVIVARNGSKAVIKGIKLTPNNIFIDQTAEQRQFVEGIRLCLNSAPSTIWFEFVQSPVNVDHWVNDLREERDNESDSACKKMIAADMDKYSDFSKTHREKEFFVLIRNENEKILEKDYADLFRLWNNAGFSPKQLNRRDYYSLISFYFENSLINDYVFSRGLFSYLNTKMEYSAADDAYKEIDTTEMFTAWGDPVINVKPSANMIEKSKLAPTGLKVLPKYMMIGDKYIENILVTSLPPLYALGLLCEFLNDPSIKLYVKLQKSDLNMQKILTKDINDKKRRYDKTHDETEKRKILTELESQQEYINEVINLNDRTHNLTIIFQLSADDPTELKDERDKLKARLKVRGFSVTDGLLLQEQLFKLATPLFLMSGMNSTIEENIGVPLTSEGVAGLYPWVYETLNDPKGFLFGEELQNHGKIIFDVFYYLNEPKQARYANRLNGNVIVTGAAGSGKTTAMSLIIRQMIKNKVMTIWIDPENKNEQLTRKYGGTYISWGQKENRINVFDLKPISSDDDSEDQSRMWDTELAVNYVIEDVGNVLKFLFPALSEDALSFIGMLVKKSYAKVGICPDASGSWASFRSKTYEDMPTFSTFDQVLSEEIERRKELAGEEENLRYLNELKRKMQRVLNEWSEYLNGYTTIRLNPSGRMIVSFGTKKLFDSSEELQNALYYIMFGYSWTLCLDDSYKSAFVVDEAHALIHRGNTSRLLSQFVRRSRKYKNVMVIGTQEPHDFADSRIITDGKAIFNNSAYKIVLGMNNDATNDLNKLESINENEAYWIENFGQGDALMIIGGQRRITIHVTPTRNELAEMGAMFL
jgi:DNA helicase HerA-like ATPase